MIKTLFFVWIIISLGLIVLSAFSGNPKLFFVGMLILIAVTGVCLMLKTEIEF